MLLTTFVRSGAFFRVYVLGILCVQTLAFKMEEGSNTITHEEVPDLNLTFTGNESQSTIHTHSKVVVCYVGTWATYRTPDEGKFDLESIDASLCTHLIYSFAGLDNLTFVMKPLDPWLDLHEEKSGGGRDWYREFNKLKRKHPHLKVLLAVGGWNEGSQKYSQMVAEAKNRETFVQSALDLVRKYSFDGLDLDWEFPGSRGGKPEDKRHFTILVQELRQKFDQYGLMLTAAFGPAEKTVDEGYELRELSRLLDHVHIMCYDYHGAWDKVTSHNAPLYAPEGEASIEYSVNLFMSHGVPAYKIVLGLPFYGRTFLLSNPEVVGSGINEPAQDKGFQGPFTKEDGFLGYNEICKKLISDRGDWKTYWDNEAKVPYMRNGAKWVGFDNPDSIHDKVSFLLAKGLKGAMIWSIDTDDFRGICGIKNPLLRTINYALSQDESNNEIDDTNDDTTATGTRVYPTAILSSTLFTFMTMLILTIFSD